MIEKAISFVLLSVVKIEFAKPFPPLEDNSIFGIYFLIKAIGNSTPIIPVDATATEFILIFSFLDVMLAISSASFNP